MPSYVTPKKNAAYKLYVGLVDQSNTKLLKANPTVAAGDFKVSTDGAAFANLATLPSANPATGRAVMVDLSAAEMNGDNVVLQCVDPDSEWCDLLVNIQTTAGQIDEIKAKTDLIVQGLQKNTAFAHFQLFMVSSTDHVSGALGLSVLGFRVRAGTDSNFVALDNSVTEIGFGLYEVNLTANDLNADIITLGFRATGADSRTITIITKP